MNIFQLSYEIRLKAWRDLKESVIDLPLLEKCIQIDDFGQKTPLVNHYLHTFDIDNWPNPWELLVENQYCYVARALGICYTLHMIGEKKFELVEAVDNMGNDVVLVLVDNAKYILNYWPNTVISNTLKDFKVVDRLDIKKIKDKIGKI